MDSAVERLRKKVYGSKSNDDKKDGITSGIHESSAVKRLQDKVYHNATYTVRPENSYANRSKSKAVTTDLSGEAWTRATPSQTRVPASTASQQADVSSLQEQRRKAQVDMDTDTVNRIDRQLEQMRSGEDGGFSAGKLAYGTIQQGADRYATGFVRSAAQYVEKPLMTAVGAVLGDPEMPDRAPLHKLSGWMDSRAEQRQAEYQENADKGGKAAQIINKWGTATAAALPSAIMAVMSGGTSAAAQGTTKALQAASALEQGGGIAATIQRAVSTMAKDPQYWASFAQVAGDGYEQAKADGASETEANLYGMANGLLNAAVEVGGGIQTLPSELQRGGSALRAWIKSMVDEGKEEVVQGAIERGLQNLTYQKGNPLASVTDENAVLNPRTALEEFKGGAIVGGILSGGQVLAGKAIESAQNRQNGTLNAAGTSPADTEGNFTSTPQDGAQAKPDPLTQAIVDSVSKPQTAKRDILSELLFGGKRVDQSSLTPEQFDAAIQANEQGTVGMDAAGKVYQVDPEQHIDRRTADSVGSRNMNAFQFDHPELHGYYQMAANSLIADAELSQQFPMVRRFERTMQGNKTIQGAQASEQLRMAMDETGLSRAELIDAAQRIINDQGQENVKAAKQVEVILDSMLTNGWTTMTGETVAPNEAYIRDKSRIAGSQPQVESREELPIWDMEEPANDGLGNANAGEVNTPFDQMQAKSDEFHPVNQNSAQRIMEDQGRAPSEVPVVNPDTGKNITKTVSTILNSPLTSPEMAVEIEGAVADGQFDYIPVTDRAAHEQAQRDISNRGLQTVADNFIAKVELGQRITKSDTASAIAAYNQAVADGNHALAFDLMTAIAAAAHDSAQVVQSMNLMNRLTPEGRLLTLRKYVDKLNRQQSNKTGRRTTNANATQEQVDAARTNYVEQATGFTISDELASNYLMAETDAERAAAWDAITTDIASQIPSTFREKANFWRYTSMLLNPTTHVRNFMGNAIQAGARTIKNGVGAVIERAAVKDVSQRTKSVVLGKEGKALRDFAKSQYTTDQKAAMGAGKYSDASAAGISREIQEKRKMFQGSNPLSRAVQSVGDFNTRLLDAEDVLFNRSAYVDSFAQALQAKGVTAQEAASGAKADLVEAARAYAIEEAQRATYRNTTALSEYLSKKGRYDEAGSIVDKGAAIVVDAFLTFRRTPANVLTTGIDYSPVGLTKAITYDAYQVSAGNMSAADMVDHLSAGLTGSGILLLGAYLAVEGVLKVRAGDDDREKNFNEDAGMQEYSLQIGDKSYTLDWAVPAAMPLFAGAAIMESVKEGGSGFDAVADAMGGISEVVLETSMLSSLNDLISNWSYADNKGLYLLDRTVTSYAGQYVPTVGGKIASAMDDTVRKSYVEKGTGQVASDAGYFMQSMMKKIPGARNALQPSIDLWGNEVSNGGTGERVFESFFSPGYLNTLKTDAVTKELQRLAEATGSSAVYPSEVEKSFSVNGEQKNLTAEEYTQYAKKVGQTRLKVVSSLLNDKGYQRLSDEDKAEAISKAYEYATVAGKMAVSSYQPSDSSFAKGAMTSVLPASTYILYKINADRDNNGSVTGTESALTLQELTGISIQQRGDAWEKFNRSTSAEKNPFTGALPSAGVGTDTSIKVYDKYRALSSADMKPKEKAAAFKQYVNSLGLSGSQRQAVKDTYTVFGSYPVKW